MQELKLTADWTSYRFLEAEFQASSPQRFQLEIQVRDQKERGDNAGDGGGSLVSVHG